MRTTTTLNSDEPSTRVLDSGSVEAYCQNAFRTQGANMKQRSRAGIGLCTIFVLAFASMTPLAASPDDGRSAVASGRAAADNEYVYSVADVEVPSVVSQRSQEILGDRFVDISISQDQTTYVIGVLDLRDSEVNNLSAAIERAAPIKLAARTVPAAATLEAGDAVVEQAQQEPGVITYIAPDLATGRVIVGTNSWDDVSTVRSQLARAISQFVSRNSNGSLAKGAGTPLGSSPTVVVRPIQQIEQSEGALEAPSSPALGTSSRTSTRRS